MYFIFGNCLEILSTISRDVLVGLDQRMVMYGKFFWATQFLKLINFLVLAQAEVVVQLQHASEKEMRCVYLFYIM